LLISRCVNRRVNQSLLETHGKRIIEALKLQDPQSLFSAREKQTEIEPLKLDYCKEYFDESSLKELAVANKFIRKTEKEETTVSELLFMIVLASLRRISFANVKKMNLELDLTKKTKSSLLKEFTRHWEKIVVTNKYLPNYFEKNLATIKEADAIEWPSTMKHGMIIAHPPYLSNTAFSESTQLQLAIFGINHKSIWQKELRCRGSFLRETNGLQKYLVNWNKIVKSASERLHKGGVFAAVVGDGQVEYTRIPVGSITKDFAKDCGLRLIKSAIHVLNNHTGQTQNRRMKGQHVLVFEKT